MYCQLYFHDLPWSLFYSSFNNSSSLCFYYRTKQDRPELGLRERGWLRAQGMGPCDWPLNWTGERDSSNPEQVGSST